MAVAPEPEDLRDEPREACNDCGRPTRYWLLPDCTTPLCEACDAKRNLERKADT